MYGTQNSDVTNTDRVNQNNSVVMFASESRSSALDFPERPIVYLLVGRMSSQYASVADWALAHAVSDVVLGAARRWDTGDELAPRTSSRSSWDRRMLDQRAEPCRSCEPDGPQYRLGRRLSPRLRYEGALRESRAADGLYGTSKLRSKFFERGHPLR